MNLFPTLSGHTIAPSIVAVNFCIKQNKDGVSISEAMRKRNEQSQHIAIQLINPFEWKKFEYEVVVAHVCLKSLLFDTNVCEEKGFEQ